MNERYAADPCACESALELKLLLNSFGPQSGRYLCAYPTAWNDLIRRHFSDKGDVEIARIETLLRRAKEKAQIIRDSTVPYEEVRSWSANARSLVGASNSRLAGAIVRRPGTPVQDRIYTMDSIDLPLTAEERITLTPSEYVRVARVLLAASVEIALVDPYLDPRCRNRQSVLAALLGAIAKSGRCSVVRMWVRADNVPPPRADLVSAMRQACSEARLSDQCKLILHLVRDSDPRERLHARYLLSSIGGIRFDLGFTEIPRRKGDVAPISEVLMPQLLDRYLRGENRLKVEEIISL